MTRLDTPSWGSIRQSSLRKANQISLAVFKPTRIIDFSFEDDERAWDMNKVREMRARSRDSTITKDTEAEVIRRLTPNPLAAHS